MNFKKLNSSNWFGFVFEIVFTTEHVCLKHFTILREFPANTFIGKTVCANNVKRYKFLKNKRVKSLLLTSHEFIYAITKPRKFQSY